MANSALEKFSGFLKDEEIKDQESQAFKKQEKEEARQAKMKAIRKGLPTLTTEFNESQKANQQTEAGLAEDLSQRSQIKKDGRATLAKAKEVGKVDLLRQQSQEFFGDNIAKLKDLKTKVNKKRSSSSDGQKKLAGLGLEIKQKQEELARLEDEPVNEKIEELEAEFNSLVVEYKELEISLEQKRTARRALGIMSNHEDTERFAEGDGYGYSPSFLANKNSLTKAQKLKYEQERTPIHKVLDKTVESLPANLQTQLADNPTRYKALEGELLSGTNNEQEERELLSALKSRFGLSGEDVAAVREVVAQYEKLKKEVKEIEGRREELWQKMGARQLEQRQWINDLGMMERRFISLKEEQQNTTESLRRCLEAVKYLDERIKNKGEEQAVLDLTARQQKNEFKQSLTEMAKFKIPINENSLSNINPALEGISNLLKEVRKNIRDQEIEISELNRKKIVWDKVGKIEKINKDIVSLQLQEQELVSVWDSLQQSSQEYEKIRRQTEQANQEYVREGASISFNNSEIERLEGVIKDLKIPLKQAEAKVVLAQAWSRAKLEKS
ncbi:MAG: hypothetical protein WC863_02940 [Patescibacteria group bacterium]